MEAQTRKKWHRTFVQKNSFPTLELPASLNTEFSNARNTKVQNKYKSVTFCKQR